MEPMPNLDVNGINLYYEERGSGDPLLFCHGIPTDYRAWGAQVAEFSNACLKEKKGLRRFLRRGLTQVRAEAVWACLSCNVSIWTRLCWKTQTKLPATT